jgi:hypothetical protein
MRKVGISLLLFLAAMTAVSQTINPNQIRPSTTNGYVLTTVGGATVWASAPGAPTFQTNSVNNSAQNLLNLVAGQNMVLTNTSGGNVRFDATVGTTLPPPFPVPNGQAVAWAYPTSCSAFPAAPSTNGNATCGPQAGFVAKYFSSPLGNCCWTANWTGFTMPNLPSDAVIQGVYGVEFVQHLFKPGTAAGITHAACTSSGSQDINIPADGSNYTGEFWTATSLGAASGIVTGATCELDINSSLGPETLFNVNYINQVAIAIYYTTATPPPLLPYAPSPYQIYLETNGTGNGSQSILNLQAGTNVTLTDNGTGTVTIAATGSGSSAFNAITSGTNTTATMAVGSGASLAPTGTGTIQANNIGGLMANGTNTTVTGSGTTASPYEINVAGAGTGTVTDGAGTTTAGIIPESTTSAHVLDYSSNLSIISNTLTYAGTGGLSLTGGSGHQIVIAEEAAPSNPSAGSEKIYADSTTHLLSCLTSTGSSCMPSGGGSVSLTSPGGTLSLSPSPITGTGTLDINLTHANTWTATQTMPALVLTGSGAGVATLTAGTAPATVASSVNVIAPTTISTAYNYILPSGPFNSANPAIMQCTGTASSTSCVPSTGSASTALVTGIYSDLSFNNVHTNAGHLGIMGASSTDNNLYYDVPTGGEHEFRINATTAVAIGNVSGNYNGLTMDGTLNSTTMNGFLADQTGADPSMYILVAASGNLTVKVANVGVFTIQSAGSAPTGACSGDTFIITPTDGKGTWCNGSTYVNKF